MTRYLIHRTVLFLTLTICSAQAADGPTISGCPIFPADNPWNRDVSGDPVHPKSSTYINSILTGSNKNLRADFGADTQYGIPFNVVSGTQAKVPVQIVDYPRESDPGPYPIPSSPKIEGGVDKHMLILDKDNGVLYEMFAARYEGGIWKCASGAKFDLRSNALRPAGWTSADAAGLPMLPGLVKYDEILAGEIRHALRFTVHSTHASYLAPARHPGMTQDTNQPPMGLRVRLKANFDISGYSGSARIILTAMKKYGMYVADHGTDWFFSGAADSRWNDSELRQLRNVPGSAFEAVAVGTSTSTPTPTPTPAPTLPAPWTTQNIGSVAVAGSAGASNDVFSVQASGSDIWDAADSFRIVSQPLSGEIQVVARVTGLIGTDPWAKAGVMIRENSAAGSRHVFMGVTAASGLAFQWRPTAGGTSYHIGQVGGVPEWVQLTRRGNVFSGYTSNDGVNWTQAGSQTITMASGTLAGLAVTSHNNSVLTTATIDNVTARVISTTPPTPTNNPPVIASSASAAPNPAPAGTSVAFNVSASDLNEDALSYSWNFGDGTTGSGSSTQHAYAAAGTYSAIVSVSDGKGGSVSSSVSVSITSSPTPTPTPTPTPAPSGTWTGLDIGTLNLAGSSTESGTAHTLKASGADIWNASDNFRFVYKSMSGDGQIVARVSSLSNTSAWAKSGLMMRENLQSNARNLFMAVSAASGTAMQWRDATGAATKKSADGSGAAPYWVKLVRKGNLFSGYKSSNGSTWVLVGEVNMSLPSTIHIGMATTANNSGALCTSVFDNLTSN